MNSPHYDIAIIGLGPAGATLARLLDPSFSVLALDKKRAESVPTVNGVACGSTSSSAGNLANGRVPGFRKPCGGLLAPDAQKAMAGFGLALPLGVLVDPQIFSVKTIDLASGLIRHYQRYYSNLDRHAFDRWLISLLPKNTQIRSGTRCAGIKRIPAGFRIVWRENGASLSATARYVVGADGALSFVRKTLYPDFKIRSYTAIQQWFVNKHPSPFYSCVFDPETTDCYAWGLTKNQYFIFGGAFTPKQARQQFNALKGKLQAYGFCLEEPVKTEACAVLRPDWPARVCTGEDSAFLIGEAAGFISPSSLEGLSYAFDSARKLAAILNARAAKPNRAYKRAVLALRLKLLTRIVKCRFIFTPWLRKLVMQSGLKNIKDVGAA